MALKIVDSFDGSFNLEPHLEATLFELLRSDTFRQQIAENAQCKQVQFTDVLFQPVPYSPTTPKGMPAELEQFHTSADYVVINVPPNFMFKAKIFNPNRLCAIYQKID